MSLIPHAVLTFVWALSGTAALAHVDPDLRVFINEIHYHNRGTDRHEAVEIAGHARIRGESGPVPTKVKS